MGPKCPPLRFAQRFASSWLRKNRTSHCLTVELRTFCRKKACRSHVALSRNIEKRWASRLRAIGSGSPYGNDFWKCSDEREIDPRDKPTAAGLFALTSELLDCPFRRRHAIERHGSPCGCHDIPQGLRREEARPHRQAFRPRHRRSLHSYRREASPQSRGHRSTDWCNCLR